MIYGEWKQIHIQLQLSHAQWLCPQLIFLSSPNKTLQAAQSFRPKCYTSTRFKLCPRQSGTFKGEKKRKKYLVQETSSPLEANKSKGFLCCCGSFSSHHHHLHPPPWAPSALRSDGSSQPFPTRPEPEDPHPGYSSYPSSAKQNKIQSV